MTQISMFTRRGATSASKTGKRKIIDFFCGGGGTSTGIEIVTGRAVDIAINHDQSALDMHAANHPETLHLCEDVFEVDLPSVLRGHRVGGAWFSPDCKHHSRAKGSKPLDKRIRGLAWSAVKCAKTVCPDVIWLENVREFEDWGPLNEDGRPIPEKKGETFASFVAQLRNLGYAVEWRTLNAADFGAPTHRRRLFLVARCDGIPIRWPEPTHGPGRSNPYRTAAECIDWSIPCPSIFDRKKPLAEKTLRRIAMGLQRYVLNNPRPFIVNVQHGGSHFRGQSIERPLSTITASHGYGLVSPCFVRMNHGEKQWNSVEEPLTTITSQGNKHALVAAFLSRYNGQKRNESRCHSPDEPLRTLDTQNRFGLVATHLTKFYGTNVGSEMNAPMPTITAGAGGGHLGEVRAFLIKYFGTAIGQSVSTPLHTITAKHRFGLVTINGEDYAIADIGLRMLTPRELLRAQFSPELAEDYILPQTASNAVAKIGNSVAPLVAAAVVRANIPDDLIADQMAKAVPA